MTARSIIRRPAVRVLAIIVAINLVLLLVGQILRRRMPSSGDEQSDEIALAAVTQGIELQSRAAAFRGGSARAIMGGIELDLRDATLDPGGAHLDVQAILGGVDIVIPEDWRVRVTAKRATLGGIDYPPTMDAMADDERPVLDLSLRATLGGVAIKAKPPDADAG
jgi:hypothetical protein